MSTIKQESFPPDDFPPHVDLSSCDREPIHLLGRVQNFGFLIGVDFDWVIVHASANAENFIDRDANTLLREPLTTLLSAETIHAVRNRLQLLRPRRGVEVVHDISVEGSDRRFDVSVHIIDAAIVLEFEPVSSLDGGDLDIANVRRTIDHLAETSGLDAIFSRAVRFVKMLLEFDRVMLYRFEPDDSGVVIAEARRYDMEPFRGLHYPASDIPKQARVLYVENPIRLIADVADPGSPVLSVPQSEPSRPLDLSGSRLRSVSQVHIEYLRNMGVGASMSISIVIDGKLWGLIACHHDTAKTPNMRHRNAALLIGQMLSLIIRAQLSEEERANDERVSRLTNRISQTLSSGAAPSEILFFAAADFAKILAADGYAVVQEKTVVSGGAAPDSQTVQRICGKLDGHAGNEIFATHELAGLLEEPPDQIKGIAGVLSIPISRSPRDYILFFKEELVRQVRWAGNPDKPVSPNTNGPYLTPRKSFEAWQRTMVGQSSPWSSADVRAASQLRIMLLEVVLRLTDQASQERKLANEKQKLLIAELNHRVRNILGLVRGLVSQSNSGFETTADFVSKLDRRIQALARAHDQITKQNWSPAQFAQLIETEAESYLLDKKDRVQISGPSILLTPAAFSSTALVIHEMITNSAKYGAISDSRGEVVIDLSLDAEGNLEIDWQEKGGPPVRPPERRGFGSTIIEHTIPFELGGRAKIDYHTEGVKAVFWIPSAHVIVGAPAEPLLSIVPKPESGEIDVPRSILVAEDNLIIAMDAEDILRSFGGQEIVVVPSVESAMEAIAQRERPFDFALLDINLGSETSYQIARTLAAAGVAFAFASGFGDGADLPDDLAATKCLNKPYDPDAIGDLFRSVPKK